MQQEVNGIRREPESKEALNIFSVNSIVLI